jgi:hypothetical protein
VRPFVVERWLPSLTQNGAVSRAKSLVDGARRTQSYYFFLLDVLFASGFASGL